MTPDQHPLDGLAAVDCPHTRHLCMCAQCAADAVRPELERLQAELEQRREDLAERLIWLPGRPWDELLDKVEQQGRAMVDAQNLVLERTRQRAEAEAERDRIAEVREAAVGEAKRERDAHDRTAAELKQAEAAIARVRSLHKAIQRGITICGHCSGWNGTRCLGVMQPHPCPTLLAMDAPEAPAPTEEGA